ncbi:T9SS type A sorting domain-containing protein [Pseudocnuella soli]|uniref:T9SS type A sorting domain-containing protein n=1 Tax=Pseudocnuella soli TaxID=2502779 RepID=UPI00104A9889|nr:T9SS type A sorting domain-containing protein [Pseudocnuella soli]
MHLKLVAGRIVAAAFIAMPFTFLKTTISFGPERIGGWKGIEALDGEEEGEEEEEGKKAEFNRRRLEHEIKMLRNPITGRIPKDFHQKELAAVRQIKMRKGAAPFLNGISGLEGTQTNNSYVSLGPNNVAGRSRTLAADRRNANILLTGGVTGGIFRSADGGANWTFVSPENEIRSVTSIVQDPTSPDIWYCGTGEIYYPASQSATATTFGYGIFKSTNNGVSWTKLNVTAAGSEHIFDNRFDLVHRLAVHPTTGHVYAAIHERIVRSTDKGATWATVLTGSVSNNIFGGLTEIHIPTNGSAIYAAFSGGGPDPQLVNRDRAIAGVWQSTTGGSGEWTRIAGGQRGQADSVAGWRPFGRWGRVVLQTNGAGNQLFVLYKNGESAEDGDPEADLFRANLGGTLPNNAAWTNLSAWVPDEPNFDEPGIDPYTTQFEGYNMSIGVKPDNNNIIFIGGTNLHRVNLAETDPARKFRRIGGYGGGFFPNAQLASPYDSDQSNPNSGDPHHPDIHYITYLSNSNSTLYTASDGGIHKTRTSDLADTVRWTSMNSKLQTMQYQFVSIIPDTEADWIIGGAQDNGTYVNLDVPASQEHIRIGSGDGAAAAISDFTKTGNNWKQYWYFSSSGGNIFRSNFDWRLTNGTLDFVSNSTNDITPNGRKEEGQWLTLFIMDPDSTKHLYYTSDNRLYRTLNAPSVNENNWTEISGVRAVVPSGSSFSAIALSKIAGRSTVPNKRLFLGTDDGQVYRMDSADLKGPATRPVNITPATMVNGSYVSGIAVNPRNPDTVLVTVSNYDDGGDIVHNIFWSGNATSATPTWQTIDGELEPVSAQSCAIVVTRTSVEYYVGTSVGLYSTANITGESTTWFNEGGGMLKRAIIRSMMVRPEDNALVLGTHGNGAFYSVIGNAISYDGSPTPEPQPGSGNFITAIAPTLTTGAVPVNYFVGTANVSRISVQVFNSIGQLLYREERAYSNSGNSVDFSRYPPGVYFLRILSVDGKEKRVQKIMKQ